MEQVYKELEKRHDDHDKAIARAFHIYDHKFSQLKKAVAAALILITLGCIVGIYSIHNIQSSSNAQFCQLNRDRYKDQLKQYVLTVKYLHSKDAQKPGLKDLNKLIALQIPKTVHDLATSRASQPPLCKDKYPYPAVPSTVQILKSKG